MVKKELYIHVGLPRTGTTFLQENVFPNMNLNYSKGKLIHANIKDGKNLISDESLYGDTYLKRGYASNTEIINRIKKIYPNAAAIAVFRKQTDWVKSNFHMFMEESRRKTVEDFQEWYNKIFNKESLNFKKYKQAIKATFDKSLILKYEDLLEDDQRFIQKICDFIDIPMPIYKNVKLNYSLKEKHYNFLRFCDKNILRYISNIIDGIFKRIN